MQKTLLVGLGEQNSSRRCQRPEGLVKREGPQTRDLSPRDELPY